MNVPIGIKLLKIHIIFNRVEAAGTGIALSLLPEIIKLPASSTEQGQGLRDMKPLHGRDIHVHNYLFYIFRLHKQGFMNNIYI
jgi:hypothetical protein